jgi:ferredoxin
MIKKIWINENCITCGNSEDLCPEVFEIDVEAGTTIVKENIDLSMYQEKIELAAASCPVNNIKLEKVTK